MSSGNNRTVVFMVEGSTAKVDQLDIRLLYRSDVTFLFLDRRLSRNPSRQREYSLA